jgi:glutathione S-transferase
LEYAFPKAFAKEFKKTPLLNDLKQRVAERPNIAAYPRRNRKLTLVRYLKSKRRLAFNEDGIFRYYPELDDQE